MTIDDLQNIEIISGGQETTPEQPKEGGFLQRLKLSFGGKQAQQQIADIEQQQGTAGRFDIGDIADVAGSAIPFAGSIIGGTLGSAAEGIGAVPGAALGAAGGEATRRFLGRAIGAPTDTAGEDVANIAKEGAYTYAGGKVLQGAGKLVAKTGIFNKLPERIYSTFFKTTADDLSNLARTGAIQNLQNTNPELFTQLTKEGIVKLNKSGIVEINPTLAQEALQRGLGAGNTGRSLEKMAEYTVQKQMELEVAARETARNFPGKVQIPNYKGYVNMLKDVSSAYKAEGYGFLNSAAKEARGLAKVLTADKGVVDGQYALRLRRLIDGMRNTSSFKTSPVLSNKQAIFKSGADSLRKKIADDIPGMKSIMNEYRFNIEAADSLIKEAARRGNNRIFSLFDAIVGGSSISALGGGGLGVLAAARTIQTPAILTAIARGLAKTPEVAQRALPFLTRPAGQGIRKIFGD